MDTRAKINRVGTGWNRLNTSLDWAADYLLPGFLLLATVLSLLVGVVWLSRSDGEWVYPAQVEGDEVASLELVGNQTVGQTFVASQAGLTAIELKVSTFGRYNSQPLTLHLRQSPEATTDVREATVSATTLTDGGWARFSFDPLPAEPGDYYFFVESSTSIPGNAVTFYYAPPEAYLDGVSYINGQPQEAQLVFRLVYNRGVMAKALGYTLITAMPTALALMLMLIVPGWAILILFQSLSRERLVHHWAEGLGVVVGLSLALYPLLLLWSYLLGLSLGKWSAWLPIVAGSVVLLWHYRPWQWRWSSGLVQSAVRTWANSQSAWLDLTLLALLTLAGVGRFLMIRELSMPLWDDSVQHVTIVQRILEVGALFESWEPYASYQSLSVHFGFHAITANLAWVTGLAAPQAVILSGQLLNLLAILALYPLAYRLQGQWAGLVTILVAGLFTEFPLYYTNWGRYPQMSGQVLLPIAGWWLWVALTGRKNVDNRSSLIYILGGACLIAGMVLIYYRMAFHFLAFAVAALLLFSNSVIDIFKRHNLFVLIGTIVLVAFLVGPWLSKMFVHPELAAVMVGAPHDETLDIWQKLEAIQIAWSASDALLILLGVLLAIWDGRVVALPVIWLWILVMLPILRFLPLPGVQIIDQFAISTSLYIQYALIWGMLGGYLAGKIGSRQWLSPLLAMITIFVALLKAPDLLPTLDRDFDLSTRPDLRAAQWIEENLPEDAFFLINGIVYTDDTSALAGDAGSWLPILTQRGVTIPLQYALIVEQPIEVGYSAAVNHLVRRLFETTAVTKAGKEAICQFPTPITHVYLGQRRGLVAGTIPLPSRPMLPAALLEQDPAFRLIYRQDRVLIFEFDRSVCTDSSS